MSLRERTEFRVRGDLWKILPCCQVTSVLGARSREARSDKGSFGEFLGETYAEARELLRESIANCAPYGHLMQSIASPERDDMMAWTCRCTDRSASLYRVSPMGVPERMDRWESFRNVLAVNRPRMVHLFPFPSVLFAVDGFTVNHLRHLPSDSLCQISINAQESLLARTMRQLDMGDRSLWVSSSLFGRDASRMDSVVMRVSGLSRGA